jgi:uncharacterized protein YndB with AHSA1/START domain
VTFARRSGGEEHRGATCGLPDAPRRHVGPDRLHGVVDREHRGHVAAGRVDVERDVAIRALSFEEQHLRDHDVRELVRQLAAEEDDPFGEEPRVDVERALPGRAVADHGRDPCSHLRSSLEYDGNPTVAERTAYGSFRQPIGCRPELGAIMDMEIHEETIEAPPEDVWGFMVDPGALSAWFGADAWLEPRPGGAVRFRFADGIERRGSVEAITPFRELTLRWREHRGAGFGSTIGDASSVTIELRRVAGGTRVRIIERPAAALATA